ncbi:MAG: aromatic amino acid transport family protein [Candidatus Nanoarchaeia archaeon]|nr:aromatic amino acid transport family protein [Candidatus Nanoarchaeia archaeon]
MKHSYVLEGTATMIGTIIGAGVLGLPYVISKVGLLVGVIQILVLGFIILALNLLLTQVVLNTEGNHQLPGYARIYLGKIGMLVMGAVMIFVNYGALVAYIFGVGQSLAAVFGGNSLYYSLIFFAPFSFFVYKGLDFIRRWEVYLNIILLIIAGIICFSIIPKINIENFAYTNMGHLFFPYGVILFALLGGIAIPEVKEEVRKNKEYLTKAVILGSLIPVIFYIVFSLTIIGVTGTETTEIGTIGLGEKVGPWMIGMGNLFAIFAMSTSFLTIGLGVRQTFNYDYNIRKIYAWSLACLVPLILFLIVRNLVGFNDIIGFVGTIGGGIEGILIVLMSLKLKQLQKLHYKILGSVIILVFILGMVSLIS